MFQDITSPVGAPYQNCLGSLLSGKIYTSKDPLGTGDLYHYYSCIREYSKRMSLLEAFDYFQTNYVTSIRNYLNLNFLFFFTIRTQFNYIWPFQLLAYVWILCRGEIRVLHNGRMSWRFYLDKRGQPSQFWRQMVWQRLGIHCLLQWNVQCKSNAAIGPIAATG